MSVYKIHVNDRYSSWSVFYDDTYVKIPDFIIDPIQHRLFSDDVFELNADQSFRLVHSTVRNMKNIPAVLVLDKNKTYGRSGKKLLYKCIPDDNRLPVFMVPYEMKHIGFNKTFENKFVTVEFHSWNEKHPHAQLTNVVGDVSKLDSFYTYQLYCKSLNTSMQEFTQDTAKVLRERTVDEYVELILEKYPKIENRIDTEFIFTIDPETTTDYDDAMSITRISDTTISLKIYISNVSVWMDALNLWDKFSERISTIYLPDRKRPMLPTLLSDCLCSLQENSIRFAFMSEYIITNGMVESISYKNVAVRVNKNYAYDSHSLLSNSDYHLIFDVVVELNKHNKYVASIQNSHDVVAYLMILMNYNTSTDLLQHKNGIYRSVALKHSAEDDVPDNIPDDAHKFLKMWNSSSGQYVTYSDDIRHELLKLDNYVHITSPIRRLVDLLNMIIFQNNYEMIPFSQSAEVFLQKWTERLSYINITMRAIRKIQCDCSLLHMCMTTPIILEPLYDGYIFDKLNRNDGLYQFMVYLPKLKLASRITVRENLQNYQTCKFKLYVFNNENKFKKKIRLYIVMD